MWFLPTLSRDDGIHQRWPLAEPTAEDLLAALAATGTDRVGILLLALERDHVLAEWTAFRGAQRGIPRFANQTAAANWLAENLASELVWNSAEEFSVVLPNEKRKARSLVEFLPKWAARVREFELLRADISRQVEDRKIEAVRNFAYGAGHELNNPLANIATRAQTLLKEETDPERRRRLAAINAQAFRAHEMIADLMLFARPPKLIRQRIDAVDFVEKLAAKVSTIAAAQNTKIIHHRRALANDCHLFADPVQIEIALRAMIVNALESLGQGGTVELSVEEIPSTGSGSVPSVRIVVRDNGPGIGDEIRPHIFDPFFSGREAGRGLGFGLCKAWRIVSDHGGRIDVESPPGTGAAFAVTLPQEAPPH